MPYTENSFSDANYEAIFYIFWQMLYCYHCYIVMFLYTIIMLGRLNTLDIRLYLTIAGLLSIFMGVGVSLSIISVIGFPFTPMHAILPFLCLGKLNSEN